MSFFSVYEISSSGLDLQQKRLEAIALNIANINVSKRLDGTLFQPLDVVASSSKFGLNGVDDVQMVPRNVPSKLIYNPKHPDADAAGYVEIPDINPVDEMTNVLMASRAYEANISVLNVSKAMAMKAMEIGR